MGRRPSLITTVRIPRSPKTVADHIVLGLVTGGLLGPGLVIDRREAQGIRFSKVGGWLSSMPDHGEIELFEERSGATVVECRIWCGGMARRRLLQAVFLGGLLATVGALAFGWLIHTAIPVGVAVGLVWDLAGRFVDRATIRRQVEAFGRNTNYLKTM